MAASKGKSGKGTILGYRTVGDSGAYTPIAEILDIAGGDVEVKDIDLTNMDSPGDYDESTPSNKATSPLTFSLNFAADQRAALEALVGVAQEWQVLYPDAPAGGAGSIDEFTGYLRKLGQKTPHADRMTCDAEVKISGPKDFTPASA